MVKNFIPNCDFCGHEIPLEQPTRRNVPAQGIELLIVALGDSDSDLEFTQKPDGDCRSRYLPRLLHSVGLQILPISQLTGRAGGPPGHAAL